MTGTAPDFDELVGADLESSERQRLLRVHDLLIAAGPPPELASSVAGEREPASAEVVVLRRSRVTRALALAAALGLLVFTVGFLAGDRANDLGTERVIAMAGTGQAADARALLEVFEADSAGNWPMEIRLTGLPPSASGNPYELWLTRGDGLAALCGSFLVEPDGTTVVPLNAPYKLRDFDGWVVVEEGSETPLLTT